MSALYIASCDHFRHFRSASEIESGVTKPTGRGGRNIPPTVSGPEQHTQRSVGKGLCRISPNFLLKKQEVTSLLHKGTKKCRVNCRYRGFSLCLCVFVVDDEAFFDP